MEKEIKEIEYSDKEQSYFSKLIRRLVSARDARDATHPEFDEATYTEHNETNAKASNSYIPPKKNKQDTRIVTGTTHEKGVSLLSALLNYNLEPNIQAFDLSNFPVSELGESLEDLVKKSRIIEKYDVKRPLIYKELLDQGDVFVEEAWNTRYRPVKSRPNMTKEMKINELKWTTKIEKVFEGAETDQIQGTSVYLGNMKEFFMDKQPYIFYSKIVPYERAKQFFGEWERWNNVPRKVKRVDDVENTTIYDNWSVNEIEEDYCEILFYQDKPNNEYMVIVNGVMMLPIEFPLDVISPSGDYTLTKGSLEPISRFFAYSKSYPAKTKVDQSVLDEFLRLIILKTQQSFSPPKGNMGNRKVSSRMFYPGVITDKFDPSTLRDVLPNGAQGVTQAEFNAFQFVKEIVDSKSLNPMFQGDNPKGDPTATQINEQKKQQMMKLGLTIYGVVNFEMELAWKRIYTILENWTKKQGSKADKLSNKIIDTYQTISIDTTFETGQKGQKIYEMNPELANSMTPDQIKAEEDFLSEPGKQIRKVYMNPLKLREAMKYTFFVTINPTEKASNELNMILFKQNIGDAITMFGPQSLNFEYLKQRYAILSKEDPDKFFIQGVQAMPMDAQGKGGAVEGGMKQGSLPPIKDMANAPK